MEAWPPDPPKAPEHDELLANVMRKIIGQRDEWDGCYIDISRDSICIDGWVNNLTPDEVEALEKVYEETRQ